MTRNKIVTAFLNQRHTAPLSVAAFLIAIELTLRVLWGYTSGDIFIFLAINIMTKIYFILVIACIAVTILSVIRRQHKTLFTFAWLFMLVLGYVMSRTSMGHFETLGGLLSLYNAKPDRILNDARTLGKEFEPMTCFGNSHQRYPCDNPIPRDKLPSSIRNMHIQNVLILDNYVLIEKFGLGGVFRGFVIFQDGSDLWKSQKAITRNGCAACWKIRVIDGLYWYSANPSDRPVYIQSLK